MTERIDRPHPSKALSRRSFIAGALVAAATPLIGWSPNASLLNLGAQQAWADGGDVGNVLNGCVLRLRPKGFLRTIAVHDDGSAIGDVCWLYHMGTSNKHILWWEDSPHNAFTFRTMSNFEESRYTSNSMWSVDDDSTKEGKAIHVWGDDFDGKDSRAFTLLRQSDGTYHIQNKKSGLYLTLENSTSDSDGNKLVQKGEAMAWEVEIPGHGINVEEVTSTSMWKEYSSYPDGPCWMSKLPDDMLLSEISIPGTHDSGTCSVDGDAEPQASMIKCQWDYLPGQLLAGIRYFDIRLGHAGAEGDPGVNHGGAYVMRKAGGGLQLSHVISYFEAFLNDNPGEALIMMVSNSDGDNEVIASALAGHIKSKPHLFYGSGRVPALGDVRGKIVLFHRFDPSSQPDVKFGLDLQGWDRIVEKHDNESTLCYIYDYAGSEPVSPTESTTTSQTPMQKFYTTLYAQDHFDASPSTKISWIDSAFLATSAMESFEGRHVDGELITERRYIVNYTSSSHWQTANSNPFPAARTINSHLYSHSYVNRVEYSTWADDCNRFIGILAMDFPDAALARSVYRRNPPLDTLIPPTVVFSMPQTVELTYGDALMSASFTGGKTLGEGYYGLVDEGAVLDVAASGRAFRLVYVHVDEFGNERATLEADVPITVHPRTLTLSWAGLDGLTTAADVRSVVKAQLETLVEGDECAVTPEFCRDASGAPGELVAKAGQLEAGTYWVRAAGLVGKHAANYQLADDAAVSFTVRAAAGGEGGAQEGKPLAATGDSAAAAVAGAAAVAAAATVAATAAARADGE